MILFKDIQAYYKAIADNAIGDIDNNSPHKRFWDVPYQQFVTGEVPGIKFQGQPVHIPIINAANPAESSFFKILLGELSVTLPSGVVKKYNPMPDGGPLITDPGFTLSVNGVTKTGDEIRQDILSWLTGGMPEVAPLPPDPVPVANTPC